VRGAVTIAMSSCLRGDDKNQVPSTSSTADIEELKALTRGIKLFNNVIHKS
jgi:hypothetical protein